MNVTAYVIGRSNQMETVKISATDRKIIIGASENGNKVKRNML